MSPWCHTTASNTVWAASIVLCDATGHGRSWGAAASLSIVQEMLLQAAPLCAALLQALFLGGGRRYCKNSRISHTLQPHLCRMRGVGE